MIQYVNIIGGRIQLIRMELCRDERSMSNEAYSTLTLYEKRYKRRNSTQSIHHTRINRFIPLLVLAATWPFGPGRFVHFGSDKSRMKDITA